MNILSSIFSSLARAEVFRLLLGCTIQELHNREIVRRAGLSESAIRQELHKLTRIGLVLQRRDGNRVYYQANRNHALFPDLRQVVLKTTGLVDVLKPRLSTADIRIAFVFGSMAGPEMAGEGEICLLVIGRIGQMGLSLLLSGLDQELGRPITPRAMTESEYRDKLRSGDHLATSAAAGPRIFVIGDRLELEALAGTGPASS